jgi:hypothetical protein
VENGHERVNRRWNEVLLIMVKRFEEELSQEMWEVATWTGDQEHIAAFSQLPHDPVKTRKNSGGYDSASWLDVYVSFLLFFSLRLLLLSSTQRGATNRDEDREHLNP